MFGDHVGQAQLGDLDALAIEPVLDETGTVAGDHRAESSVVRIVPSAELNHAGGRTQGSPHHHHVRHALDDEVQVGLATW